MKKNRNNEKQRKGIADTVRQTGFAHMAERPPDKRASADFHRPVYQAATLVRKQAEQMKTESVEEYLARKYKIGGELIGNDDEGKTGSVPEQ